MLVTIRFVREIRVARRLVADAHKVAVFTGAGVSTGSGIGDYRGENGLWRLTPRAEADSHIDRYRASESIRVDGWVSAIAREGLFEPNEAHDAIGRFSTSDKFRGLVTQNVDGLHWVRSERSQLFVELHGSWTRARCIDCGIRLELGLVLDRVRAGEADPSCEACGGILDRDIVRFGERLDPNMIERARGILDGSDLVIVAGTTLSVRPASNLVKKAYYHGARLVVINQGVGELDSRALVVRARTEQALEEILAGA